MVLGHSGDLPTMLRFPRVSMITRSLATADTYTALMPFKRTRHG